MMYMFTFCFIIGIHFCIFSLNFVNATPETAPTFPSTTPAPTTTPATSTTPASTTQSTTNITEAQTITTTFPPYSCSPSRLVVNISDDIPVGRSIKSVPISCNNWKNKPHFVLGLNNAEDKYFDVKHQNMFGRSYLNITVKSALKIFSWSTVLVVTEEQNRNVTLNRIPIEINAIEINDAPVIVPTRLETTVTENVPIGFVICSFNLTDPDQPTEDLQVYSTRLPVELEVQRPTATEVRIVTRTLLDANKYDIFKVEDVDWVVLRTQKGPALFFTLTIEDDKGLSTEAQVVLTIEDIPDEVPICTKPNIEIKTYFRIINETVTSVKGLCSGGNYVNKTVTYSLLHDNCTAFRVSTYGEIIVRNELPNKVKTTCYLTVQASDDVDPSLTTDISVVFTFVECPADTDYMNVEWDRGMPGNVSKHTCPKGSQGTVSRYCNNDGVYQDPVYNCTRSTIADILYDIRYNKDRNVSAALDKLANASKASNSNETLFIGDMNRINDTLSKITDIITVNTTNFDHLTGSFIETANNIIEEKTTPTWKVMLNQTGSGAESVLQNIDRFVEKIVSIKNTSVVLPKSNLYLKIGAVKACEKAIEFPDRTTDNVSGWASARKDQLTIDCSENTVQSYSGVMYRNLSRLIPSTTSNNVSEVLQLNAPVMSFTFFPNTNRKLEKPIQLKFQMFNKNLVNPRCSFWSKSDSNSQGFWSDEGCQQKKDDQAGDTVVCVCNHLTNFAVLMQPSTSSQMIDEDHVTALSYISMVGCIVSMVCLFLNVVIHVYFWRAIKGVRSIIHINLSCSLFVAYLIFLPGINKTENKDACTAIAVLLHLVFLIVFFLMLTEGCNLAYTVIKPLSTRKPGLPLLISSYVLAVFIVAVSMGAVQMEGYGTKQACWLSTENGLIWAFLVPVLVVIMINFIIVTIVIRKMCGMAAMSKRTSKGRAKAALRCILILMPIMGFTWVFGFFALNSHTVMFQYLFAIFNSFQGLLIFIFHCVMSKKIRDAFRVQKSKWIPSTTSSGASSEAQKMKTQNTTDI